MDLTITGQARDGKFVKRFEKPLQINALALTYLVVRGAVVEYPVNKPLTFYIMENPSDAEVKAGQSLTYTLHTIVADAKNYTDYRDVLANVKRKAPLFNGYLDFGPQDESRTILPTWDGRVCRLLVEGWLGRKMGGRPFNYEKWRKAPGGGETLHLPQIPDGLFTLGCSNLEVVHLRKEPLQPAIVKLLLKNTTRSNCFTPTAAGIDERAFVIATLPSPTQTGFDIHIPYAELVWNTLGEDTRQSLELALVWGDGSPLVFDTPEVSLGLRLKRK